MVTVACSLKHCQELNNMINAYLCRVKPLYMNVKKFSLIVLMTFISFLSHGQVVLEMEQDAGVYKVPCKVNGLKLKFIFDTGASSVSISSSVADMMLENDYLSKDDIVGNGYSQIADGRIVDHTRIILKTIEIGGLVLHDVEAIVMNQQSAPLLLGQSAIQKLGKVSISGNKLTITSYGTTNPYHSSSSKQYYSIADIENLYKEADMFLINGDERLAAERLDKIYNTGYLSLAHILNYADCLGSNSVGRPEDALEVLLKNEEDVIYGNYSKAEDYYAAICRHAYWSKEYYLSIEYGGRAKALMPNPLTNKWNTAYWVAASYDKIGNRIQAQYEINTFISSYLKYMEISATDCWDKEYIDPFLGKMFYALSLHVSTGSEEKKYNIIAAAWWYDAAIEYCNKMNWQYSNKPYDYVY